jgi:hypothetical protein
MTAAASLSLPEGTDVTVIARVYNAADGLVATWTQSVVRSGPGRTSNHYFAGPVPANHYLTLTLSHAPASASVVYSIDATVKVL